MGRMELMREVSKLRSELEQLRASREVWATRAAEQEARAEQAEAELAQMVEATASDLAMLREMIKAAKSERDGFEASFWNLHSRAVEDLARVREERDAALVLVKAYEPAMLSWCHRFPQKAQPKAVAARDLLRSRGCLDVERA